MNSVNAFKSAEILGTVLGA